MLDKIRTPSTPARGRPSKFGRPSRLVAVTLPHDVVDGLRKVHPDLARAIVSVFEHGSATTAANAPRLDVIDDTALVSISDRSAIIVVNRAMLKRLPGIRLVPLGDGRALLALEPGCGLADLETSVAERIGALPSRAPERRALTELRRRIRGWRREPSYRFRSRTIIVVERRRAARSGVAPPVSKRSRKGKSS